MISLNLITTEAKKDILKDTLLSLLKDILLLFLCIILINSILVFISRQTLSANFKEIEKQKQLIQLQNQPFNQEVEKINQKLKAVSKIQSDFTKWSDKLIQLTGIIPNEIQLSHINFDKKDNLLKISGTAKTRESFIKLKDDLESSDIIFGLESPLSNLLKQENFEFTLTGTLTNRSETTNSSE